MQPTLTTLIENANQEERNLDHHAAANTTTSNSEDASNHRLIIMIIAICAVSIVFIIIIGCYWKIQERRLRQKKSPSLSFSGNPSLSTSLLINRGSDEPHEVTNDTKIVIPDKIQTGHVRNESQVSDSTLGLEAISPAPRRDFGRKRSNGYDRNVSLSMSRSRSDAYHAHQQHEHDDPNTIREKNERSVTDSLPFSISDGILQDLENDNNRESVEYSNDRKMIAQRYNQCTLFQYVN